MNVVEADILESLRELERVAKDTPSGHPKLRLQELFVRVDDLARALPKDSDPNLRHYLRNKSYQKARLLLEGRDTENRRGSCAKGQE